MKHLKLYEEQTQMDIPVVESSLYSVYQVKSRGELTKHADNELIKEIAEHLKPYSNYSTHIGVLNIKEGGDLFDNPCFILEPKFESKLGNIFVNFETILYTTKDGYIDISRLLSLPQNIPILNYFNKLWKEEKIQVFHNDFDYGYLEEEMGNFSPGFSNNDFGFFKGKDGKTYLVYGEWGDLGDFFSDSESASSYLRWEHASTWYSGLLYRDVWIDCDIIKDGSDEANAIREILKDIETEDEEQQEAIEKCLTGDINLDDLYEIEDIQDEMDLAASEASADQQENAIFDILLDKLLDFFNVSMDDIIDGKEEIKKLFPFVKDWTNRGWKDVNSAIPIENPKLDPYQIIQNRLDNLYGSSSKYNAQNILDILKIETNTYYGSGVDYFVGDDGNYGGDLYSDNDYEIEYDSDRLQYEIDSRVSGIDCDIFLERLFNRL